MEWVVPVSNYPGTAETGPSHLLACQGPHIAVILLVYQLCTQYFTNYYLTISQPGVYQEV